MRKKRRWKVPAVLVTLSVLLGVGLAYMGSRTSYEEAVVRAEMYHVGLGAQTEAALVQYPAMSPMVFATYGADERFQQVLRRFGHNQTVPIVWKCLMGGDGYLDASYALVATAKKIMQAEMPSSPDKLSPIECGAYALELMLAAGNDFLGQYDIDSQGVARRLPGSSVAAFAKRMFTSGLQVVEKRLVRGERPTLREAGLATLDVASIGTLGLAGKAAFAAKAATASKVAIATKFSTAVHGVGHFAALAAPHVLAPVLKLGVLVGSVYLVVTQPQMVMSAANTVLNASGISPWAAYPAVLFIILFLGWRMGRRGRRLFPTSQPSRSS